MIDRDVMQWGIKVGERCKKGDRDMYSKCMAERGYGGF
jgi:hypothetical protein